MKTDFFYNLDHAKMYLNNTLIRLGDKPIYIVEILEGTKKNSKLILKYNEVGNKKKEPKTVNMSHPSLNFKPVPLGWLSLNKKSTRQGVYLQRVPNRTWHIGLCRANLSYAWKQIPRNTMGDLGTLPFFTCKELRDTIIGKYLPVAEAIELGATGKNMYPFSRRFAVHLDNLYYKYMLEPVGKIVEGKPLLTSGQFYLQQILDEDLNVRAED